MRRELTAERVRRDVEVLAHAGLDHDTFLSETLESLGRAVPFVAACVATVDPSTRLLTGARKYGDLSGRDDHDHEWGLIEYGDVEATAFTQLAANEVDSAGVHVTTGGDVAASQRMSRMMIPYFGYSDELRTLFLDRGQLWGAISLFRDPASGNFEQGEVDFLASLSQVFARGTRTGILASLALSAPPAATGPTVLIVGEDDTIQRTSMGAEARLADLVSGAASGAPAAIISSLVGAARRYARGETSVPPRSRVRARSGMWLVLHATPLTAGGCASGDVVVTIEEARPPEIVPLVVAAFDLTQRERDVTQLVLQGVGTKEIAATMHVSSYTVQDHLKSVFDKADVRSRRELIARIYFDQYVPRMGSELGPSGWFTAG